MDYRIKRFGVASTALTVAIIYFVLGLVIAPLNVISGWTGGVALRLEPGEA